jgi:hypothetical protein
MLVFDVRSSSGSPRRWESPDRDLTIGRDPACDIELADANVSRFHAVVVLPEQWACHDRAVSAVAPGQASNRLLLSHLRRRQPLRSPLVATHGCLRCPPLCVQLLDTTRDSRS